MRPSLLTAGFVLGPKPFVMGTGGPPKVLPTQICAIPVSAPVFGSLLDSKAIRPFLALRTGLRLVPRPWLTPLTVPSRPVGKIWPAPGFPVPATSPGHPNPPPPPPPTDLLLTPRP